MVWKSYVKVRVEKAVRVGVNERRRIMCIINIRENEKSSVVFEVSTNPGRRSSLWNSRTSLGTPT